MMKTEDLSFVADALLAIVGAEADERFEFETDCRKPAPPKFKIAEFVQMASHRRPGDVLLQGECREILDQAKLTDPQAEVLDLRLGGLSFEQIGMRRGSTRQSAMRVFLHAIKKIGRVMRVYPYTGLSDVYRNEVRRGAQFGTFGKMGNQGGRGPR